MLREADGPLEASIFVEALRAAPAALVACGLVAHALLWAVATHFADPSPSPQMAIAIALGRETLLGYPELPPLAAWLSDAIYRATHSLFAIRLAAASCIALAGWFVFLFARRVAGDRQAAIAVLMMVSVYPVAFPGGALTGDLLQMPLLAGAVLCWWIAVGEKNPAAWMPLGLLLAVSVYAGPQGVVLFAVLVIVTLLSAHARSATGNLTALFAILVALLILAHVAGPRAIWLYFHGAENLFADDRAETSASEASTLLRIPLVIALGHFGFALLIVLATFDTAKARESAPVFARQSSAPFSRRSVIAIAIVPALLACAWVLLDGQVVRAQFFAPLLLFGGLAAVLIGGERLILRRQALVGSIALILLFVPPVMHVALSFAPGWFGDNRATNWPAAQAARIFTEIFQTRTGRPLAFVAGDRIPAAQIAAVASTRPRFVSDADLSRSPWIDATEFKAKGGVVFWEIRGADSAPPAQLAAKFPALVIEAPLRLSWARGGGEPVRLGWAIVPPAP